MTNKISPSKRRFKKNEKEKENILIELMKNQNMLLKIKGKIINIKE